MNLTSKILKVFSYVFALPLRSVNAARTFKITALMSGVADMAGRRTASLPSWLNSTVCNLALWTERQGYWKDDTDDRRAASLSSWLNSTVCNLMLWTERQGERFIGKTPGSTYPLITINPCLVFYPGVWLPTLENFFLTTPNTKRMWPKPSR